MIENVNDLIREVHVPITTSSNKRFLGIPEKAILSELRRKMKAAFANQIPEFRPLLLPNTEFSMKARTVTRTPFQAHLKPTTSTQSSQESRPRRSTVSYCASEQTSTPIEPPPPAITMDLKKLEAFAKLFMAKRTELNLSQAGVARSLKALYGVHRSSTLISRVERMDLSLNNLLQVYPVLAQWLRDASNQETREAILDAASENRSHDIPPVIVPGNLTPIASPIFRKRRSRTTLSEETKQVLRETFAMETHPPCHTIHSLAKKLDLDVHVVRVWFYNQRMRHK